VIHVDVANTTGVEDGTSLHPFNTISEAVALASSSVTEEIWVRKGTYSLSSPITISKKVNLYGGFDGTEQSLGERDWANKVTTIDGQSTAGCFTVTSDVTFDGLRINNCKPGITVPSSVTTAIHPVIANCSFTGNSALEGGALSINSHPALMQVTNTRFENNTATDRGGAIYNYGADINILQCEFVNNRVLPDGNIKKGGGAIFNDGSYWVPTCNITGSSFNSNYSGPQGGAIINYKATGVIYNCSFWGNEAPSVWGGGAIYNRLSIFTIDFCEFTSNTTGSGGGAINNEDSPSVIQNCTFVNNHAGYYGGAIRNYNPQSFDSPKILNCIFLGNSTDGEGGAISNGASPPNITNCTFSNNSSTNLGGAIYSNGHTADNKHPKITNCILWNNTAPTNPEIGNSDSTPSVTYCDVQGGYSGTGNKNIDPKFDPNLRLLDGSPCLDAGSNSAPDILATDMDGIPRVIDYDRNGAAVVDMGAYEHAALRYQPHSGTINTETWGSGTHYVTASVTVADNQMLTIEPCAVIKFAPNTQLLVYGTLRASGTSVCPIVFTSRDDDSHGETIVDSDGTPAAGDWYGIYLNGNSNYEGIGEFDYCIIRYGGNASGSADANVHFYYSDSGHMTNSTSEHSAQHGVRISTCSPQITGSQLSSNGNSGLYVSGAGSPTITGNNFTGNSQYGAELNLTSVNPVIYGNTGSGNLLSNGLVVSGTVGSNQTWSSTPLLPIVLQSSVSVSNNVRLTIEPGTIVKFGSGGQLYVYGALDANGAKDNPVVFTSLKDDTYGGDTNGDGTASAPAAGDWYGIYLNGSSTYQGIGEFDFCIFRYGGNAGGSADANVYFYYSDSGHMTDCTIEHSVQHGVRISTCSPLITKSTFQNNVLSGLYASGAGSPTISGNIFISNDQYGAYMNLTSVSPVISGNTGTGNQTNAFVFEGTVNVNQTWSSGPGFPIVLLSAVTVSNNIRLTIEPGTVVKFAPGYQFLVYGTLDAHGTDGNWVVFTSLKDDTYGGDTNSDGAATAPAPGDWYGIYLNGNSSNQGIGEFDYCLFRYGGNPTGSADANVYFYYSDSGYMINCISEHSVQQGVRISNCSPLIANSTITKNTLYGLSVATGSPRIINGIVWSNTAGGISGGTPVVLYSDVQGGFTGEGNINADPLFLDIAKGDYRLDDCSPAADSGDPVETLTADYSAGALVVTVDQVTAVQPGSTVWITDGVNLENGVVASTTANTITVTNGFANSYTLAKKSYLFTSTSDYYGEPDPNGQHIDMGAYGGTSEAVSPLSCRADLAGTDQDVDGSDLRAFITAFGDYNPAADFNNDGIVNGIDLAVFAEQFGRTDCAVCP
jgi:predicted outer membrane repeat protein/parallel beta-helix repeat protein